MACDATSLIASAAANGYQSMTDRMLMLILAAVFSSRAANLTAQSALNSGTTYQSLNDRELYQILIQTLC